MRNDIIDLKFDQVSKRYLIRQEAEEYAGKHPILRKLSRIWEPPQEFWAVRDVSFEVKRGEALGIIGHNGAGKSTILKLLANITIPSSGEITIGGRMAALIEVGSGFHPELTGRENVYLSGSILGMRRSEISRKLDSIIEFAGIRQFIDTPVKRYSSGMFVRLGFAIAAHLDPDVLLLDEVLAVGDAAFQAKCLNRVDELRRSGKTIIFISHDLNAVERMCDRVLLLERGKVVGSGSPQQVIEQYKASAAQGFAGAFPGVFAVREWTPEQAPANNVVRLVRVRVCNEEGETVPAIDIRKPVKIEMTYDVLEPGHALVCGISFFNESRIHLFDIIELNHEWRRRPRPVGRYVSTAHIPGNFFSEGAIILNIGISSHYPVTETHTYDRDVVSFQVVDNFADDSARGDYMGPWPTLIRPLMNWTTELQSEQTPEPEFVQQLDGR